MCLCIYTRNESEILGNREVLIREMKRIMMLKAV